MNKITKEEYEKAIEWARVLLPAIIIFSFVSIIICLIAKIWGM